MNNCADSGLKYLFYKNSLFVILILIPISAFPGELCQMPDWFWNLPRKPNMLLAAGYATPYANRESSYQEAFDDAAERIYLDRYCHVMGSSAIAEAPEGLMSMGGVFKFEVDTAAFKSFKKSLCRIDSVWTPEMVVMLVATAEIEVEKTSRNNPGFPDPASYYSENGIIAVGVSPDYYFQPSSWIDAERNARKHAAVLSNVKVKATEEHINNQMMKTANFDVDVNLRNMQTIARGFDPETKAKMVILKVYNYNK